MTKKQPQTVSKQIIFNVVIAVCLLFTTFVGFAAIYDIKSAFDSHVTIDFINNRERIAEHTMLEFCYEQNIHPCDKTSLEVWNTAHPDNTFSDWPR